MAIAETGIGANGTSYQIEARNPSFDMEAGTFSVEIFTGDRNGRTGFIRSANYTMRVNGGVVDEISDGQFAGREFMSKAQTLSGNIDTTESSLFVEVNVEAFAWDSSVRMTFTVDVPKPQRGDFQVDCSLTDSEIVAGDTATVSAVVSNGGDLDGKVVVSVSAAGVSEQRTLTIPAGGSGTIETTFAFDATGDYTPDVAIDSVSPP